MSFSVTQQNDSGSTSSGPLNQSVRLQAVTAIMINRRFITGATKTVWITDEMEDDEGY